MTDPAFFLAPIRLFTSDRLLSARYSEELPPDADCIIADLDRAMLLENAQDVPDGYRIWKELC